MSQRQAIDQAFLDDLLAVEGQVFVPAPPATQAGSIGSIPGGGWTEGGYINGLNWPASSSS